MPDALKEFQQSILSGIMQEAISSVDLLPEDFTISRESATVTLPPGHIVLNHTCNREKDTTLLLAADYNNIHHGIYVIVVQRKKLRELIYGFHIQESEDRFAIKDLLVTSAVEGAKTAFLDGVVSGVVDVLKSLWSAFGSLQALVHHSEIVRWV